MSGPNVTVDRVESEIIVRLSILFLAALMLAEGHQNFMRGRITTHPEVTALVLVSYGLAFSLIVLATLKHPWIHLDILGLLLAFFTIISSVYVLVAVNFEGAYRTDDLAFTHYSAMLYLRGANPYTQDLQKALTIFSVSPEFLTLTWEGKIVTNMNYPALHFLVFVPAVAIGVPDMRYVVLIFEITTIAMIFFKAPRPYRVMTLIPIMAGTELAIGFTAGSLTDFLWVLPAAVTTFYLEKPRWAGAAYGVACAMKQIPWIAMPFLLIWQLRSEPRRFGIQRLLEFTVSTALVFLAFNIQFMIDDLQAWVRGILTPLFGGLVILSQGLSVISQANGVPLSPNFYLLATLTVSAVLIINYYTYFESLKYALWILPGIILWFSFRALQSYFVFWIPLVVASIIQVAEVRSRG
jgi:uncharacterized membrane protein